MSVNDHVTADLDIEQMICFIDDEIVEYWCQHK